MQDILNNEQLQSNGSAWDETCMTYSIKSIGCSVMVVPGTKHAGHIKRVISVQW
jgi:hypothetical protein